MPTALVTGGAGFIGSHIVRELLADGYAVTVLDDLSGGFRDNVPDSASLVEGSVCDSDLVEELFKRSRFDYVYHLAAYAAEGLSHYIRRFNYTNNVVGSVNLVNSAIKYRSKCFVFTSSIAVYGANQVPMIESLMPRPEDPYGIAKLAVEQDLAAAHHQFGLPYVIFRPHNVYGENQNIGDRYRNVVGIFMNQLMSGEPMTVFGDGTQRRAFSYIGDVAPVIARAPFVPGALGEVFNIGADVPYSVNELAETVAKAFGLPARIKYLSPRNEVLNAFSDHSKVQRVFGVRPFASLEDGIGRMARWAKAVGPRSSRPYMETELIENLPEIWRPERSADLEISSSPVEAELQVT